MITEDAIAHLFHGFPLGARPDMPVDSPELRNVYITALDDISPEQLDRVVRRLVRTSESFPTIAEVRAKHSELFFGEVKRDPAFEQALGRLQRFGFPRDGMTSPDWETVHAGVHARIKERIVTGELNMDVVRNDPHYVARECYRLITGVAVSREEYP